MIKISDVEEFLESLFIADAMSDNYVKSFELRNSRVRSYYNVNLSIMKKYLQGQNSEYVNFIIEDDFSCTVQCTLFDWDNVAKTLKKYEKQHMGYKKITKNRILNYHYHFNFLELEDLKKFILENIWENLKTKD